MVALVGRQFLVSEVPLEVVHPCMVQNNYSAEMWSGSEEGSYSRRIDYCITQL